MSSAMLVLGPLKRKAILLPNTSESPVDVVVPNYSFGKYLVLDVAITCPLQHKYLNDASVTAGFVCNEYAENILPFILQTFGVFSDDHMMLVISFTDYHPMLLPDSTIQRHQPKKNMYEMISCVLMKSLARSVSSRFEEFCPIFTHPPF